MATIGEVADGLAQTISTATGLRTVDYIPEDINPPVLFLALASSIERGAFQRGQMELMFDAVIFTSRAVDRVGQKLLYEYASFSGDLSVWKAVDDDNDLGLTGTNAAVLRYRPLGIDEIAGYGYFGGAFEIMVLTAGS